MSTFRRLLLAVLAIVTVACGAAVQPSTPTRATFVATPYQRRPTATPTVEDRILAAIGEINRNDVYRPIVKSDDQIIAVVFPMNDALTTNWMRRFALDTILDIARAVRDNTDNTHELRVVVTGPLTDAYGNTSEEPAITVHLKATTLERINFDGFDIDNLPMIADHYWQHPALDP
jgi:hypothetical protein